MKGVRSVIPVKKGPSRSHPTLGNHPFSRGLQDTDFFRVRHQLVLSMSVGRKAVIPFRIRMDHTPHRAGSFEK
jgi:hypothetical protein